MKFRFSLLNLCSLVLIVALGVGWVIARWRQHEAEARYRLLVKDWVDNLLVTDPSQFLVKQLPARKIGLQQWRLYIPPDQPYELCCGIGPSVEGARQLSQVHDRLALPTGQAVIEIEWHRGIDGQPFLAWALLDEARQTTVRPRLVLPQDFSARFAQYRASGYSVLGSPEPQIQPAGSSLPLFCAYPQSLSGQPADFGSATNEDGILIWIQPIAPPAP
ncbi:MAG: hypothetical protein U0935_23860 [Pirellulales bacterium]